MFVYIKKFLRILPIYKQLIVKGKLAYEIRFITYFQYYIIIASLIIPRKELRITL